MKPLRAPTVLIAFAIFAAPSVSAAGDTDAHRDAARALASEAQAAFDDEDCALAAERFARADALFHAPTLLLGLARSEVCLGKLGAAREVYLRIVHEGAAPGASPVFFRAVEDAESELALLEKRIVSTSVAAPPPLAPQPVPLPLAPVSSVRSTLGFVALGLGGAALVTAAVTGILALQKGSRLASICGEKPCPEGARSIFESYAALRVVAGSMLLTGAALAGTGAFVALTAPKPPPRGASVRLVIGPGHLGMEGTF